MKQKILSLSLVVLTVILFNCKQEEKVTVEYQFSDQPEAFACKISDGQLIKEAIYSFEKDIKEAYDKSNRGRGVAYASFIGLSASNRIKIEDIASKHSLKVAKALQKSEHYNNNAFQYNGVLANCIFDNIKNVNTKTSFNALRAANSLRPNVVLGTYRNNTRAIENDKALVAFLALDYFYNKLMLLNESDLKTPEAITPNNQKVDFNKTPRTNPNAIKKPRPGHEGHNHD